MRRDDRRNHAPQRSLLSIKRHDVSPWGIARFILVHFPCRFPVYEESQQRRCHQIRLCARTPFIVRQPAGSPKDGWRGWRSSARSAMEQPGSRICLGGCFGPVAQPDRATVS